MFVERSAGAIVGIFSVRQYPGQEELSDDHPDLVALALKRQIRDRLGEVSAELARRNAAGFAYGDHVYQLDNASQARITSVALIASVTPQDWPSDFVFITADNQSVPFKPDGFLAFATAAFAAVVKRRLNARALKDALNDAADEKALAAIDVTKGWDR